MSAMASSGGFLSEGGPYYMISRAMGPTIGATVGLLYWLGISLLAVLETLGAVETILIAEPRLRDTWGAMQIGGSLTLCLLVFFVYSGIKFVTKLGTFIQIGVYLILPFQVLK